VSEPTYRVELTHHPENGLEVCWRAAVYNAADAPIEGWPATTIYDAYRATSQDAFDAAQAWCKAKAEAPLTPETMLLTESGDVWEGSVKAL
jgi:hypothetical protein